jgi:hypothetical protein
VLRPGEHDDHDRARNADHVIGHVELDHLHHPVSEPSHYDTLGVEPGATAEEIRAAYLAGARDAHPDIGGDAARMRALNEAWSVLGHPARRSAYDAGAVHADARRGVDGHDASDDGFVDELPPDDDETPLGPPMRSPIAVLPAAVFAASVLSSVLGVVLAIPYLVGVGALLFALSFVAVGFVTLLSLRSGIRARDGRR